MGKLLFTAHLKDNFGGKPFNKTIVYCSLEEDALKLLFISKDSAIISKGLSYNDKLYEGDTVELMITLGDRHRYLELEVNPDGVQYAAIVTKLEDGIDIDYVANCPFSANTERVEGGWRSEWLIPFKNLVELGWDKEDCYFNLYRQDFQGENLNLYALSPTECATFHRPERFIKLTITKQGDII